MAFTPRAAIIGSLLGIILSLSLSYFALSVGLVFFPILLASIFSTALLRSILLNTTVHEINLTQTIASTAAIVSAASAFVFPAALLFLPELGFAKVSLTVLVSGLLGVVFSYEFHERLIRRGRFVFFRGQEASVALRQGDLHGQRSKLISIAFSIGSLFSFLRLRFSIPFFVDLGSFGVKSFFSFGLWLSSVPFAGGYLSGPRVAVSWFAGSLVSYYIIVPMMLYSGSFETMHLAVSSGTQLIGLGALLGCAIGYFLARMGPEFLALFRPEALGSAKKYSFGFFTGYLGRKRILQAFTLSFAIMAVFSGLSIPFAFFAVFLSFIVFYLTCISCGRDSLDFFDVFPFFFLFLAKTAFSQSSAMGFVFFAAFLAVSSASALAFSHNFRAGHVIGTVPLQQFYASALGVAVAAAISWLSISAISGFFTLGSSLLPAPQPVLLHYFLASGFNGTPFLIGLFLGIITTIASFKMDLGLLTFPFSLGLFMPFEIGLVFLFGGLARHFIDSRNRSVNSARIFVESLALGEAFALSLAAVYHFLS